MMTVGYCVNSIKKNEVVCDACLEYVLRANVLKYSRRYFDGYQKCERGFDTDG